MGDHGLVHDDGAHRADRAAVAAGQAFVVVDRGKAVFIPVDGPGRAGVLAGAAPLAVLLIDIDPLVGHIGVVIFLHAAFEVVEEVIDLRDLAKADHDRIEFGQRKGIVESLLVMGGQAAAAKGLH